MELNDYLSIKAMEKDGLSPYEQYKVGHMQAKSHTSGIGVAGLTVGVGAAVLAVGGAAWAASRASNAKDVAIAKNDGLRDLLISSKNDTNATLDRIARSLERETDARVNGDLNITNTINDTVSGSQQGTLSQSQQLSNELTFGLMTGRYSENPQRVAIYQDAKPCPCPASGCGCNG